MVESLPLLPAWGAGNVSLLFPISSYFYPVILTFFPNKLCYHLKKKKRENNVGARLLGFLRPDRNGSGKWEEVVREGHSKEHVGR
jgi:hypothetical protein